MSEMQTVCAEGRHWSNLGSLQGSSVGFPASRRAPLRAPQHDPPRTSPVNLDVPPCNPKLQKIMPMLQCRRPSQPTTCWAIFHQRPRIDAHITTMKSPATQRLAARSFSKLLCPSSTHRAPVSVSISSRCRAIHSSAPDPANVSPFYATGPPPEPPQPAPEHPYAKIERRRKQAELLRNAKELRKASSAGSAKTPLKKRFWQDVHVKEVDGACPLLSVMVDETARTCRKRSWLADRNTNLSEQAHTKSFSTPDLSAIRQPKPSLPSPSQNPSSPTPLP